MNRPADVVLRLLIAALALVDAAADDAAVLGPPMATQSADVAAVKRLKDGSLHPGFQRTHEGFVTIARSGRTKLLFIGDSITEGWRRHQAIWDGAFGTYHADNFGIGWDRTQNVLWRLENGELDGMTPTLAVVMIGTNNLNSDPAEDIARAIRTIATTITTRSPTTKVLLLGIFPRGQRAERNRERDTIAVVNGLVAKWADGKRTFYLDIGARFLEPNGDITREMMPEFLHLTEKGYRIWAEAIGPTVAELMK